jgi:excisionase family DNA binding protein
VLPELEDCGTLAHVTEGGDDEVSPAKAAARLGVDRTTVYKWIKAGKVETVRTAWSGRLRIPLAEVERIKREREEEE